MVLRGCKCMCTRSASSYEPLEVKMADRARLIYITGESKVGHLRLPLEVKMADRASSGGSSPSSLPMPIP